MHVKICFNIEYIAVKSVNKIILLDLLFVECE